MAVSLEGDITRTGINQGDLVRFLENVRDLCNELRTDVNAAVVDLGAIRTAVTGITAQLDADAGVTDTTYASGNDPAALTATSIAETALTLSKG